ncbi:MAG: nitroreductase-like protein [Rhizobium sp.]|nr:nitroreductase-like protein [Rhizobium sp.]
MTETNNRSADFPIDPIFLERWSARSFPGEPMPEDDLLTMFEAARWSHSSGNGQPWRFSYTLRTEPNWQQYVDFLTEGNQPWAQHAGALVIVISKLRTSPTDGSEPKPIRTHSLDTGAALQSFTLQAALMGYVAHPMAGIHADRIRAELGISEADYMAEAAIAVGRLAPREMLSERFRGREVQSQRKPLSEILFKGSFKS